MRLRPIPKFISRLFPVLILIFLGTAPPVQAGISSQGTDFWVTFPQGVSANDMQLFITSALGASVTIQAPGPGFNTTATVAPGGAATILLPPLARSHRHRRDPIHRNSSDRLEPDIPVWF